MKAGQPGQVADAIALPAVGETIEPTPLLDVLEHEFHVVQLDGVQSQQVRHGIRIPAADAPAGLCGLLADDGNVLAFSEAVDGVWKHAAVFA